MQETFRVPALDCSEELALIEKALAPLEGIESLQPNYLARTLQVSFDARHVDAEQIRGRIAQAGFPVERTSSQPLPIVEATSARIGWSTWAAAFLLLLAAVCWASEGALAYAVGPLAIAATVVAGASVATAAWRAIKLRAVDMNVLMTIAAVGALGLRDWFEAATAMLLFNISLWLERASMDRARRAVHALVALTPDAAHRIEVAGLQDVHPDQLAVGERVLVKPGERIPADGRIVHGVSAVNQATITGESMPVEKITGDAVYAGTHNGEGALEVQVERPARDSTLANIARRVEQAQVYRAPTARFVDQFARRYTPAVIIAAVLIAIVPPLLFDVPFTAWLHRSLVLLVIACPCALVISTPVTIVLGLYQAARRGILIKGGEHLERAGRISSVAFDKTGTLTTGRAAVLAVMPLAGTTEAEVLQVAASLEQASDHPLAQAILAAARARRLELSPVSNFSALRGFGVQGKLSGETYFVGSPRMLEQRAAELDITAPLKLAEANLSDHSGATIAVVGSPARILGSIALADATREGAAEAVAELHALGVRPVIMLTGDSRPVAEEIARQLKIDEVHAELLPDDKVREVASLARRVASLAMVGDGVNDAPALAAAHLGIALGSSASDVARETADVVIVSTNLSRVAELVRLGRKCRALLMQNITLSLAMKLLVLLLALADLATMWMAVAADVGASLLVIANGMRLVRGDRQENTS